MFFYVFFSIFKIQFCITGVGIKSDNESSITLPKPWTVSEVILWQKRYLCFSYISMIPENQIDTSKSVLNYYVHGKLFEVKSEKFPQVLLDLQTLPTVLSNFQHMNVCAGLGSEDLYIIAEKQAFKDTLGYWRHNKCLLLSANKHCKVCNRLKKTLLQKNLDLMFRKISESVVSQIFIL